MASKFGLPTWGSFDDSQQPASPGSIPQQPWLISIAEDWSGLSSAAERRRLQNRKNQRTYRKRKAKEAKLLQISKSPPETRDSTSDASFSTASFGPSYERERDFKSELWRIFESAVGSSRLDRSELSRVATVCKLNGNVKTQQMLSDFEKWAQSRLSLGSPTTDNLIVIVKLNVFRALISNSNDLGLKHEDNMPDDALSLFTDPTKIPRHSLPSALRPTRLQCEIPHHPWLDLLPIPRMRDNLLLAGDSYDDMELCGDLVGFFSASSGKAGMIVWGQPWDPSGWEVTEPFLKYWGWTIRGCSQLLESTNYWRQWRGEAPMKFDPVLCEEVNE